MNCALPALWKGILYDDASIEDAWRLVAGWSWEERQALADAVCKDGLRAPLPGGRGRVLDAARELLRLAHEGLARQGARNAAGDDERRWLHAMDERLARGASAADDIRERWHGEWKQDPKRLIEALTF